MRLGQKFYLNCIVIKMINKNESVVPFTEYQEPFKTYLESYVDRIDYWKESTPNYKLNDSGFYCDNFTQEHKDKHILFSGCSVTFAVGLELKENWAHKVFSKINETEKLSGYFNLSQPGQSVFEIVTNIFKYCNKYGNPDSIFINIPDPFRMYVMDQDDNKILHAASHHTTKESQDSVRVLMLYTYQYLLMLSIYCKSNNIKFYCFSYTPHYSEVANIDGFYLFGDSSDLQSYLYEYKIEFPDDKFVLKARDGSHHGTGYHKFWAEKVLDLYNKDMEELCQQSKI